jgi:hypothetical protein
MKLRYRSYLLPALLSASLAGAPACKDSGTERWVTTSNTNVDIDWDAIGKAYQEAEGPEDFERRVNEIYTGDEIISVSVVDKDAKTQVVTGFFDKNTSGGIDEGEKVFEISRNITGEGTGEYQVSGYGHYAGYHSPMLSIMTGMMLGSMLMGPMRPGYVMMSQPYTTPPTRQQALSQQRTAFRQANPSRFSTPKGSQSGRTYGSQGSDFNRTKSSAPRRSGGGMRFGAKPSAVAVRRLEG